MTYCLLLFLVLDHDKLYMPKVFTINMSQSVHSIVREMESSIEFIQTKIVESELLVGDRFLPQRSAKLFKALESVEKMVSTITTFAANGGDLNTFSFKGRSKEYMYMISELRDAWKN